jgi:ribonuclease HI
MAERFRAAIDGGSRGNPGPAAWGVAILDPDGACREGHAGTIGHATNNVAEYRALLAALRLAAEAGAREVEILCDSQLIVRQILGEYRVKHPDLKPLFAEALRRIGGFASFHIEHVRRERNVHSDRMVNLALDRAESTDQGAGLFLHETFEPPAGPA